MKTVKVKPCELHSGDQVMVNGIVKTLIAIYREFDGYRMIFENKIIFTNDKWDETKVV